MQNMQIVDRLVDVGGGEAYEMPVVVTPRGPVVLLQQYFADQWGTRDHEWMPQVASTVARFLGAIGEARSNADRERVLDELDGSDVNHLAELFDWLRMQPMSFRSKARNRLYDPAGVELARAALRKPAFMRSGSSVEPSPIDAPVEPAFAAVYARAVAQLGLRETPSIQDVLDALRDRRGTHKGRPDKHEAPGDEPLERTVESRASRLVAASIVYAWHTGMRLGQVLPILQHISTPMTEAYLKSCISQEVLQAQRGASEATGAIGGKAHAIRTQVAELLGHSDKSSQETYLRAAVRSCKSRS
jgi:hypothetical protein